MSLLGVALLLPVVLAATLNPDGISFLTKADKPAEMRIWLEPAEVLTKPGVKFKLAVMGEYTDTTKILPSVDLVLTHAADVQMTADKLNYVVPFRGTVKLGEVEVTVKKAGEYQIMIPAESVRTGLPDLPIITTKANIISRL